MTMQGSGETGKTAGILFSGFDAVGIGMLQAGISPAWAIEKEPEIAAVAQMNLSHKIIVADILSIDPALLEQVDLLHASPPCPSFSIANAGALETEIDLALARKVAEFVRVLKPRFFTLENVRLYRKSESWLKIILPALFAGGYMVDAAVLCAAAFGVPQERWRFIVRAVRGGFVPWLPPAEPWQGWFQAVEDLIPGLPESQFAGWQMAVMPENLKTIIVANGYYENLVHRAAEEPIFTITANSNQAGLKAFIVNSQQTNPSRPLTVRDQDDPMFTILSNMLAKNSPPKAFIVDCQYGGDPKKETRGLTISPDSQPMFTVMAGQNRRTIRAQLSTGRVVSMSVHALARFQSFPNWYRLPENKILACKGIGNAYPSLWYRKLAEGLIKS